MSETRAQRAELEAVQTELRAARVQLTVPLDRLREDVSARLDVLAQEAHALSRTVEGLNASADEARLLLVTARTDRPETLGRKLGTSSLIGLSLATLVGGAIAGLWLERQGFPDWLALLCCGGAALILFVDLSGIVRWMRK